MDINFLWIHIKMLWIHNVAINVARVVVPLFDKSRCNGSDFLSPTIAGSSCLARPQYFVNLLFISFHQSWGPMKDRWWGIIFFRMSFQDLKKTSFLALLHSHVFCQVQKELEDSHHPASSIKNAAANRHVPLFRQLHGTVTRVTIRDLAIDQESWSTGYSRIYLSMLTCSAKHRNCNFTF